MKLPSPFRHLYALLLVAASVAFIPAHASEPSIKDLRRLVVSAPDSVLDVLDEMEKTHALPDYRLNLLRGLAYNEKRVFPLVAKYARLTLAADSIEFHDKERLNALTLLSQAQSYFGDLRGSIESSSAAMEIARASGNLPGELNILTTMAETAFQMGDSASGFDYIDRIIRLGADSRDARVLANVSAAYGVLIVGLYAQDRFDEGLARGRERLGLIDRIDRVGGAPDGFTDQQRAYAYARIASCAERAGLHGEAKDACEAFMATDYAAQPLGRAYISDYLLDSGNWSGIIELTQSLFPLLSQGDTINDDFRSLLAADARAMAGLGKYREAYALSNRASLIADSIKARENTARTRELAALFALNEKDLELAETRAELREKQILTIAVAACAVFVLIILLLLLRAYRLSIRQHRLAIARIDELMAKEHSAAAQESTDSEDDRALFADMQQKILESSIFRDPDFNRDNIADCSGLSRAKVINLIDRFARMTPGDYINKLRVEHSLSLINDHPDWTIDAIAEECGYVSRATYYRHFNKFFGITPARYRTEKSRRL